LYEDNKVDCSEFITFEKRVEDKFQHHTDNKAIQVRIEIDDIDDDYDEVNAEEKAPL